MAIPETLASLGTSPGRPRILVITLRRLGDVLLTTPLIRSLRRRWPDAQIDTLVFAGTQGILAGNPDLNSILTLAEKASPLATLRLMAKLRRRYDLAISTQTGDRPTLFTWIAGRSRIGLVKPDDSAGWIKRRLLDVRVPAELTVHRVTETLRLVEAAGAAPDATLVPPQGGAYASPPAGRYAVLHPNPKYPLRRWTRAGWHGLAAALRARGLAVVVTGGPDPEEKRYLDDLWAGGATPVDRRDGQLDWPQLAALIGKAAVYVGPDTSMTHLAAATGCPTVGLYGPASPVIIGPWPRGGFQGGFPAGLAGSWAPSGTVQHRGNVWLVQNPAGCPFGIFPCERLGCDGHLNSRSQCLDELTAEQVLSAVDAALAGSNNQAATSGAT
ncbi:MAG: glycosyltransferase family 9 protein [Pseudolabrys sp.]